MIKRISLVRRKDGMTTAEFTEHWLGEHAAIIRALPGLRGYRLDIVASWAGDPEPWDGIGELWFDSRDDLEAAFATVAEVLAADRAKFVSHTAAAYVDEHVIVREPPTS